MQVALVAAQTAHAKADPDSLNKTRWHADQSGANASRYTLANPARHSDRLFRTIRENDISTILAQNETECPQQWALVGSKTLVNLCISQGPQVNRIPPEERIVER